MEPPSIPPVVPPAQPQPPPLHEKSVSKTDGVSSSLLQRLESALSAAFQALNRVWLFIKNPVDHDWRKNQKYKHLMQELRTGLEEQLSHGAIPQPKIRLLIERIQKSSGTPVLTRYEKGSGKECLYHLENALRKLYDPEMSFDSERERYKSFTESFLKALSTDYYKTVVKEGQGGLNAEQMRDLEMKNPYVGLLHTLAFVQFSAVNTLGFTQSVAEQMAQVGGYTDQPDKKALEGTAEEKRKQLFDALAKEGPRSRKSAKAIKNSDSKYNISWWSKIGSTFKGHASYMDFDPLHTGGNPANIHHKRLYPDGSEVTILRLPSPTIGSNISPDFKAYLRALKSRGESHAYFNLQDRRSPEELTRLKDQFFAGLGFIREDLRVDPLESLNQDPEFKDVIHVLTLDKNSAFYWQHDKKGAQELLKSLIERGIIHDPHQIKDFEEGIGHKTHFAETFEKLRELYRSHSSDNKTDPISGMKSKSEFIKELKRNLLEGDSPSFYVPKHILDKHKAQLESLIDRLAAVYFFGKGFLSPGERQIFIELSYDLLTDYLIRELKVNFVNISCKDCIDRGEGQLALKQGKDFIMEILHTSDGNYRPGLLQEIQAWHANVHGSAIWARKRPMRVEREMRLLHAMDYMLSMALKHPEEFRAINKAYQKDIPAVSALAKEEQRVRNFKYEMTGFTDEYRVVQRELPDTLTELFQQATSPDHFTETAVQPPRIPEQKDYLEDE